MASIEEFLYDNLRRAHKAGNNRVLACCPSHKGGQEKNPSFIVNTRSGRYFCYSCQIKGSFDDLKILIGNPMAGVYLNDIDEDEPEYNEDINEVVLQIFHMRPIALAEAGFGDEILMAHEIGYDDIQERITFPIRDSRGKLVAISGRDTTDSPYEPRYKVYTHRELRGAADENYKPQNKKYLWGAHLIPPGTETVYIVEGYKACMWVRQAGVLNTVATMGTMVKQEQLSELHRLCDRAILLFDMDEAGISASKKLQLKLLERGLPTTRLEYQAPAPDDLTQDEIRLVTT